jgi:lipoprotein-anchoring transpeptidase ErfK/SrfK
MVPVASCAVVPNLHWYLISASGKQQQEGRLKNPYASAVVGAVLVLVLLSFATAPPASHPAAVSYDGASARIRIDISERRLYLEENGAVARSWPVAVGTREHPTPRGSFGVRRVIWNPRWVPPETEWAREEEPRAPGDPKNPMGRVKIFFREPAYYIHGTIDGSPVGRASSHGCVRMRNPDVIELARLLMRHGGAPVEAGLIRRLINNVRHTREVRLRRAIPVRVES